MSRIANFIKQIAIAVALVVILTQGIFIVCMGFFGAKEGLFNTQTLVMASKVAITAIVIMIVCVPEGLQLAGEIAMALSTGRLKDDKILVKNGEAI